MWIVKSLVYRADVVYVNGFEGKRNGKILFRVEIEQGIWIYPRIRNSTSFFRFQTKGKNITVPTTANAVESCTTDTFEIEIVWGEEQHKNSILLHFSKMGKNLLRYVIINVFMDKENFPDAISMHI